ncbi:NADP-dependent oxidoreductase [Streptomyces brasiliensis]|uniref:Zinc-binding alcohol dehydrogenase n=1 Tax=Streptomyces brasiliensis TaxID=1954 RepID=A0A917P9L7_9ACTN|nr:NADP-dependent oxidoreductase [Streptomyces brasiliensis]GGJ67454.1 zinc-binding alcohol dehydrogenase [Streptomyces brasiliensis]
MRVVGFTEPGGPEALGVHEVPDPHPGPGEVAIRVHGAAVNAADLLRRQGLTPPPPDQEPPYVPGMDAAGVVDAVGDGAPFAVGDRVMAIVFPGGPRGGAYAERIVVPAASVVRAPDSMDLYRASTILMNALTATLALEALELSSGDTLLVTGSLGAFGGYAVELATAAGVHVVADAKPGEEDLVLALGAAETVPRGPGLVDAVRARFPEGVTASLDTALLDAALVPAVRDGGRMAVARGWRDDPGRSITVHNTSVMTHREDTARLARLAEQTRDGVLTPRVADVLPVTEAAEAHRRLEAGGVRGRLVLDLAC